MFKSKRPEPVAGEIYRHFKGNLYEIVTVAVHTESSDRLVIYKSVETPGKVFARPVDMFMSDVDHLRYPFVKAKYRFTLEKVADATTDEAAETADATTGENAKPMETAVNENAKDVDIAVEEDTKSEEISADEDVKTLDASVSENTKPTASADDENTKASECADPDDCAKYKEDGTLVLDPFVEAILDEKEFTKKIENFQMLRGKCTEEMLTTLAISLDVQLCEGTIDDKYAQILKTLRMHEKYESARLRF